MSDIKAGYTRVSSILGQWDKFGHIDKSILEAKCTLGTGVHNHIQNRCDGIVTPPDIWEQGYVDSWESWVSITEPHFAHTELRLYDNTLKITGAIDAIIQLPGSKELIIVDYKTSATPSPKSWALQGNFYHYLCRQNGLELGDRILFLQLKKTGKSPKLFEYQYTKEMWSICMSAYNCYRYLNS